MEAIHCLGKNKTIRKSVGFAEEPTMMLGQKGSYLWIGNNPTSRYQGWFFRLGSNLLLKIVEDIKFRGSQDVLAMENNFSWGRRIGAQLSERFMLYENNCLAYESSLEGLIDIFLDVKEPYQNPEFGRHYRVWRENDLIIVNYYQETPFLLPQIFIAIGGDVKNAEVRDGWARRDYPYDRRRGSAPWERWVFKPAEIRGRRVLLAAGPTKEEAINALRAFEDNYENIKLAEEKKQGIMNAGRVGFWDLLVSKKSEIISLAAAKRCAQNALEMLYSRRGKMSGLRAGLPWFFQFWQRDEAISLNGLSQFDHKTATEIFWRQMEEFKNDGYRFDTADGAGWLFLRAADFIYRGKFDAKENAIILSCLEKGLNRLWEENTVVGLAVEPGKTWMDSLDRPGAAIEIQALRLNMYALAQNLAADKKSRDRYSKMEADLLKKARQLFYDGKTLADHYDIANNYADRAIRPNIFLAAYAYPELLIKAEWEACFDAALGKLWLDWGGLSTIDKGDARYHNCDTGQDAAAYHNGDSWFWVNNIAAIVMARINRQKFKDKIEKILAASTNDILWGGAIGCASEISSAESYDPCGCPNQAWSNATFLELCRELKK